MVPGNDPAKTVADLKGYRIFLGPADCDEKHAAAREVFRAAGIDLPGDVETCDSCTTAATKILELGAKVRTATVISSYAQLLLEGCGTIKKGDIRVIGHTADVPFIGVFLNQSLDEGLRAKLLKAFEEVNDHPPILQALETRKGFRPLEKAEEKTGTTSGDPGTAGLPPAAGQSSWPGWRGPRRDGRAEWLPEKLPGEAKFVWRAAMQGPGLGGIAATKDFVLIADREGGDRLDVLRCLHAATGEEAWRLSYPAPGKLDYGNSSRATPLIDNDRVFFAGAHGHFHALDLKTGRVLWKKNLPLAFGLEEPLHWGLCASPLLADGKLILYPGGPEAALVALDPADGSVLWKSPGRAPSYGSWIVATFGGVKQIIGHDTAQLTGWDLATGKKLWALEPETPGDFHVPTPIVAGDKLVIVTEAHAVEVFRFEKDGKIDPNPVMTSDELAHDTHTPVVVGQRLLGVQNSLVALDLGSDLKVAWKHREESFKEHTSLIATEERLLLSTHKAELLLIDIRGTPGRVVSRLKLLPDEQGLLSHPALCGTRLYFRGSQELVCLDLAP